MSANSIAMCHNMSDLCRVCLLLPEESQYLDLTTIYDEEDNLTYGECFTICTQIDLSSGEGLPHNLCKPCGLELQMSYDFHKKIEESKRLIKKYQKQLKLDRTKPTAFREECKKFNISEEEKASVAGLNEKYIISVEEQLPDEAEEMCVLEEEFVTPLYEETNEIEIIDINQTETSLETQVLSPDNNSKLIDTIKHLDMEDYQNVEEAHNVKISSSLSHAATNDKAQNCVHINQGDFNANFGTSLTEETVIVEEISQDATEKWLDTLSNSGSHCIKNSVCPNVGSAEMPETLGEQLAIESDNEPNNYENVHPQEASSSGKNSNKSLCKFCIKTFPTANRLQCHIRTHDKNRKRFICPVEQCSRIYASKQSCEIHYKQTHLDEGYMCQICRKIFSAKQTLEVHMRYHTKVYPYKCNLCDRKFAQKGHLTQHIEVKHQNLRYICPEPDCCKVFQNSVSLRNHHYTHSSMPFKCSHCDKQYPQKNKLKNHLLHKHNIKYSLEDLEEMRQFNIIRTRHAFVKVQAIEVEEHKHTA